MLSKSSKDIVPAFSDRHQGFEREMTCLQRGESEVVGEGKREEG